ncbi:probable methyltransferase-like protein 23 isoform X2 [Ricinus communis]|uniref:probable methyltransferase-like protein 23 isoform X2 n=1 Tax=Ricinus communis TaxID=3988 RepID=UPI00201A95E3|nr:probable methyltransferase-like protein 23 isoform X2 [Ricinus communis]
MSLSLQLGAGTSLPGLAAAKLGSHVTLTDDSNSLEVLDNIRKVCYLNKLKCKVLGLTWGIWNISIFDLKPNIILGADVLYESSAFDDLFATVTFLLQKSPGSVFITTYHNRSGHHLIEFLMVKWGLKCVKLLDGFSFMPSHKASGLSGNIQLAEIMLNNEQTNESNIAKAR